MHKLCACFHLGAFGCFLTSVLEPSDPAPVTPVTSGPSDPTDPDHSDLSDPDPSDPKTHNFCLANQILRPQIVEELYTILILPSKNYIFVHSLCHKSCCVSWYWSKWSACTALGLQAKKVVATLNGIIFPLSFFSPRSLLFYQKGGR